MINMTVFIFTMLTLSMVTAHWAHQKLGKNYWDAFFISLLLSPLAYTIPFLRYKKLQR